MILTHAGTDERSYYYCPKLMIMSGTGSILEALRMGVPLVVVPNPDLQDNHQMELAREMHRQGYVVATAAE
jgi:UDP-N-acetylglucosamine transferase subunit ALG13